jgi:hypothetical protein
MNTNGSEFMELRLAIGQDSSTDNLDKTDCGLFNMDKEGRNNLSSLNINFNPYEYLKQNTYRISYTMRYSMSDSYHPVYNFIGADEKMIKLVNNLRKQVQNEHSPELCKLLYNRNYPYWEEARTIKSHILGKCADEILKDIKQTMTDDFNKIIFNDISVEWDVRGFSKHSEGKDEMEYFTSKSIILKPNVIYPDERAKEIINDTLTKMQEQINEFTFKKTQEIEEEYYNTNMDLDI